MNADSACRRCHQRDQYATKTGNSFLPQIVIPKVIGSEKNPSFSPNLDCLNSIAEARQVRSSKD
jgi:hypothetical protein